MQLPFAGKFTFATDDMWLSEFRLLPSDPSWHMTRRTTDDAVLIAFPRTSVAIRQAGRSEIVADPLSAVIYGPGQPYRRRLITAAGDDSTILAVSRELVTQIVGDLGPSSSSDSRFDFSAAATEGEDYMAVQRIRHRVATASPDSQHGIREELLWLLGRVFASGFELSRANAGGKPSRAAIDLVRDVLAVIGRDVTRSVSLTELSRELHVSPFHMVRVFRSVTGRPIHAYHVELRLRAALPLIADGVRLADVAQEVGFASHAHLTDRFARAFGVSPQVWRFELRSPADK